MNKVLIITRDFPPNDWPDGWMLRTYSLAKYLLKQNYHVHVICFDKNQKTNKYDLEGLNIYSQQFSTLYDFIISSNVLNLLSTLEKLLLRKLLIKEWIDGQELTINKYYKSAFDLIQKYNIKNVIISTPPHSLQIVGLMLKKELGNEIKWIADFRDPWSFRKKYQRKFKYLQKRVEFIEKECFKKSDKSVVVSEGMLKIYSERYGVSNIIVVENGYSNFSNDGVLDQEVADFLDIARKDNRIILGYFGVGGTGQRNDGKSFDPIFSFFSNNPNIANRFSLLIQGEFQLDNELPEGLLFRQFPPVANNIARLNINYIDIGIFIYSETKDSDAVMGGKIYDYIGSNVIPWFIVPSNSYSIESFVLKTNFGFISDIHKEKTLKETALKIIDEYDQEILNEREIDNTLKQQYSREYQFQKILRILK